MFKGALLVQELRSTLHDILKKCLANRKLPNNVWQSFLIITLALPKYREIQTWLVAMLAGNSENCSTKICEKKVGLQCSNK